MRPGILSVVALIAATHALAEENAGLQMMAFSKKVHVCLDREANAVAPKPVDLETATVAIMARCSKPLEEMRNFIQTGIPNFTPNFSYWEKEIEPSWTKEARKKVALARTRDAPSPPPKPPAANNKNQM